MKGYLLQCVWPYVVAQKGVNFNIGRCLRHGRKPVLKILSDVSGLTYWRVYEAGCLRFDISQGACRPFTRRTLMFHKTRIDAYSVGV